MADGLVTSVHIYKRDGGWFFQLPGSEKEAGPYPTSDDAVSAVADLASKSYTDVIKKALGL